MYTEALIELGIIGFALFVSVLIAIYRLARQTLREIKKSGLDRATGDQATYYIQLGRALQTWFVMCVVFSIAHYGISEPWWYLFAGLITVWARCVKDSVGALPVLATNPR
jgi:O-antigen ligase